MEPIYDVRNSYQGVEDNENFKSEDELKTYRELCLKKSKPQADFIEKAGCTGNKTLEIGCGNGRLLFELKRRGLINTAIGMDVSESRIAFANAWCKDLKMIENIKFEVGDVTQQPLYGKDFDLIICITSAIGLVAPLVEDGDKKMLEWMIKQASPYAKFIFEVYRYPLELAICKQANGSWVRLWNELPPNDPFRFFLHERRWDEEKKWLYHKKLFIHRKGWIDESRGGECQRIYTPSELKSLIESTGLSVTGAYGDWSSATVGEKDELLIITAQLR